MQVTNFIEKINENYPSFSSGHKKVGKYVMDHPQSVALNSASQLGQEAGVSETTVIRFCYALGYSGYSELQNEVRKHLIYQKSSIQEYLADKEGNDPHPTFFVRSLQRDMANIQTLMEKINMDDIHLAARKIYDSNNILVTGVRTSFAVAHWLSFTLNIIKGHSHLVQPGIDDINYLFTTVDSQSVFIAISFHRYSSMTLDLAELAKKQGAFVIGITDSALSPLRELSDILIPINLSTTSTIDSAPAVFSLVNAIVAGVTVIDKESIEKRREAYENFYPGKFLV